MAITDKLTAVADAIRGKTGKAEKMTLDQMPGEIEGIQAGGGGDIKALVERTITEIEDDTIEEVGASAFRDCVALKSANFPNCKAIRANAFNGCSALTSFNFDSVIDISAGAFGGTYAGAKLYLPNNPYLQYQAFAACKMVEVEAPNLSNIPAQLFQSCKSLRKAKLPAVIGFSNLMFYECPELETLDFTALTTFSDAFAYGGGNIRNVILRKTSGICALASAWLERTKIGTGEGYIYVPRALIEDYKAATNWATYSTQFRALEDYTVDGTVTGELDESKI